MDPASLAAANKAKAQAAREAKAEERKRRAAEREAERQLENEAEAAEKAKELWAKAWEVLNAHYKGVPLTIDCNGYSQRAREIVVTWFQNAGWTAQVKNRKEDGRWIQQLLLGGG